MSIRKKIVIPMSITSVLSAIIISALAVMTVVIFVNDFNITILEDAHGLGVHTLETYQQEATRASTISASDDSLISGIEKYWSTENRDDMVEAAIKSMDLIGVDFLTILDLEGNVLVRAHEPDNYGDSLASQENIQSALNGKQLTATEKGTAVKLSVRCGTPIYDKSGQMIAVVSTGFRLDQDKFVDEIKSLSGTEATVFLGDTRVSTTVLDEKGERAVGTQSSSEVSETVLSGGDYMGEAEVMGRRLLTYYSPIRSNDGEVIGMLFVGQDTTEVEARIFRDILIMLGVIVIIAVLSLVVSMVVASKIARPIKEVSEGANRLALGDIDVRLDVKDDEKTKDESVILKKAFMQMIEANRERANLIKQIAEGDLSASIKPMSDKDVVSIALINLLNKNNAAFIEIATSSKQLDSASSQISDGAQSLAQSTTKQAAAVEQLLASATEISGKTRENADLAAQASSLVESIKASAQKGSRQMDNMMEAVNQISESSNSISNVMKAIDGIAFQTNILALNAAVEAARAGVHGKGFAVVAEEVRNLAAKSAAAAKNTGGLITDSMEKAELGVKIANETVASFGEIVTGINQSGQLLSQIAKSSDEQSEGIKEINKGLDQVSDAVQHTSATAQQSAAASEEMSSQAVLLHSLISQFKLRDQDSLPHNNSGEERYSISDRSSV